jgi:hypothetical protein
MVCWPNDFWQKEWAPILQPIFQRGKSTLVSIVFNFLFWFSCNYEIIDLKQLQAYFFTIESESLDLV